MIVTFGLGLRKSLEIILNWLLRKRLINAPSKQYQNLFPRSAHKQKHVWKLQKKIMRKCIETFKNIHKFFWGRPTESNVFKKYIFYATVSVLQYPTCPYVRQTLAVVFWTYEIFKLWKDVQNFFRKEAWSLIPFSSVRVPLQKRENDLFGVLKFTTSSRSEAELTGPCLRQKGSWTRLITSLAF